MPHRKTTLVALATVTALLAAIGPAAADSAAPTSSASTGPTGDGAKALCKRGARIDKRIDKALTRLNGPVTRRGSIARLQKRVDNAKAAGHDEIETYLNDRLTFRTSLVPTLKQRSKDLARVTDWCRTHNNGATA
ncbi:MAG: hypothetical protein QOF84_2922 [Streptomyces sp.]|jgi:hypothetical protein|nr:hypothetical protein [Streptomyces sp.]